MCQASTEVQGMHDVDRELWGHMAFATDPPYYVTYPAEYKHIDDPSRMTFYDPSNHGFAMTASNMWYGDYCLCLIGTQQIES